jgi:nucleotide-binding universal stress UspA family protein
MDRPYRRIACCIDRDGEADHVLREGLRLCGDEIGSLEVVHVVASPRAFATSPFAYVAPLIEVTSESLAWLEEMTHDIPQATPVLLDGSPAREICSWSRANDVDLIIAAARRGIVERAMLGGFASHIAYHASCSVLLVHPPSESVGSAQAPADATATDRR